MVSVTATFLIGLLATPAFALAPCESTRDTDPPAVDLLTTAPGAELFSTWGHSALWLHGGSMGDGVVFNWGTFDPGEQSVAEAFLNNTMVYQLGLQTRKQAINFAKGGDRVMVAQRLDLPPEQLLRLVDLLNEAKDHRKEGYAYDYVSNNCSTQLRDILDQATGGALSRHFEGSAGVTVRDELLRSIRGRHVLAFGIDFLGGRSFDRQLTRWDMLFLPDRLREGLDEVSLAGQPLVTGECVISAGSHDFVPLDPWRRAPGTWLVGLAAATAIGAGRRRRVAGSLAVLAGLVSTVLGLLSPALVFLTGLEHVSGNWNLAVASPLSLLMLAGGVGLTRGRAALARPVAGLVLLSVAGTAVGLLLGQDLWATSGLLLPPLVGVAVALRRLRA